ncbi:MAG TPA: plasmid pRiA4b ORF-3 family protein [Mycobacterium sp.]|nr:plasmid pRiA4b ORF-3 family protein [Mycobacterium sp.]HTX94699.1 plasmid pRiA4b ORF-3 family protein [Mycobacterium sp.]
MIDSLDRPLPPSRRRPRRPDVMTYQVRVDLAGTTPPTWRRLEVASDVFLDDLHEIIQIAFGWTDSHLHRFACGPAYYSDDTEYYLMPFEVDEGETGVPEHQVRLDEVLVDVGDRMFYCYDFGDDWQHVLRLEAVEPQAPSRKAVCTQGDRDGPAEDCGGIGAYELIEAVKDPTNDDPAAEIDYRQVLGDIDPYSYPTTLFDIGKINAALGDLDRHVDIGELPGPLADLLGAVRTTSHRRRLRRMMGVAMQEPVLVDLDAATAAVRPYAWLIDRVGDAGIKLTAAGYLPPVDVEAAFTELDLADAWIGMGNREQLTIPVLHLRESAQRMGLLRKHRGRLMVTARGKAARGDPTALWFQLAERMPLTSKDVCEEQAGLLFLIAVAAGENDPDGLVADMLDAIGWMHRDRTPITRSSAGRIAWDTRDVMRRLRLLAQDSRVVEPERVTPQAVAFARAAVRSWPSAAKSTPRS